MTTETYIRGLRVPFGLKDGRLYTARDTERGLACGCRCPDCGCQLIANKGEHKRDYFSHYQSRECAGGYESAIHLMAKQIIEDKKYIFVPEYHKTLERTMDTGEILKQDVSIPGHRLEFVDVFLEKRVDGLRPDVIGVTSDGIEVFIEVLFTHAVTDNKRELFAKKNLIELDLSTLPQDIVSDGDQFTKEVLSEASREWISCHLYREEIANAKQALQKKVERWEMDQKERELAEQNKAQWEQDQIRRKAEIESLKIKNRESYSYHLKQLRTHSHGQQEPRLDADLEKSIAQSIGLDDLPEELNYSQNKDWIFKKHRTIWQSFIYERYIHGHQGRLVLANEVKTAIVREIGLLDWVHELISCELAGAWFFTPEENYMIPKSSLPYDLIFNYFKYLSRVGLISQSTHIRSEFLVKFNSLKDFQYHKAELEEKRRLTELKLQRVEEQRKQKYLEDNQKRISFLIDRAKFLFKNGVRDIKRCANCHFFQEPNDGDSCLECNHSRLWEDTLSKSYIETLPHRLRSVKIHK